MGAMKLRGERWDRQHRPAKGVRYNLPGQKSFGETGTPQYLSGYYNHAGYSTPHHTPMTSSYPVYQVTMFGRRTRRTFETMASGLTMDSARALAAELRETNREREHLVGFRVETMPLEAQVDLLASGETMSALRMAA